MVIDHQMNPEKYTQEQLEDNAYAARAAYDAAYTAAAAARAADADYVSAYVAAARAAYWLNEYFKKTGENKQDYIDAINKDNKQ